MTQGPVFICGPDRSGTTLLYALLAAHPNISMSRRSNMWRYFHGRYGSLSQPENFERCLHDLTNYHKVRHLQPDAQRLRQEFWRGEPSYGRLFGLMHSHAAQRVGKHRWGDKSLHTERYVDRVFAEFPDARVLQMIRDPRDRYASARKRFNRDTPKVGAFTARWLLAARNARRNLKRYPDRYLVVRYESLAADPEGTLRDICAFIDEPYDPRMISMQGVDYRDSGGNSSFGRIEPGVISTSSIGRFRVVLSPEEIAFIQLFCDRDMTRYDYALETIRFEPGVKWHFATRLFPVQMARMLGWWGLTAIETWRGAKPPLRRPHPEPA
jgi:hypothetical protein